MKHDVLVPTYVGPQRPPSPDRLVGLIAAAVADREVPPDAAVYFANRMATFMSSCDARRLDEWHRVSWLKFIGADRYGEDYRRILGELPQFTQASKASDTAAEYIASFLELFVYNVLGFGANGPCFRVLDAPTNEAWIYPWVAHLRRLGAQLNLHHELVALEVSGGQIVGAQVRGPRGIEPILADWYVCALPVERARRLWTSAILAADPTLARMNQLGVAWMNGIQFYLRQPSRIVDGIYVCTDSPWALTFIPQAQFWKGDFASRYGDGTVHDKLSAAIADWTTPGVLYGKAAADCTPEEIAADTWQQIKQHVNKANGQAMLRDDMLHSWQIDPGMLRQGDHLVSDDPLVLPTKGTRQFRPNVTTAIPNLMLCGDYLQTSWIITTMESANHTGRRAANAIVERASPRESPAIVTDPYQPPEWQPLRAIDEDRYRRHQPNIFDLKATATNGRPTVRP